MAQVEHRGLAVGTRRANFTLLIVLLLGLFEVGCADVAQSKTAANAGSPSQGSQPPANTAGAPSQGSRSQSIDLYLPSTADCAVPSYAIDPGTGFLSKLSGSPFATGGDSPAQALTSDPAQRFFFTGNVPIYSHGIPAGNATISAFKRNAATGILSLQQFGISINPDPDFLAVDESGRFLYTYGGPAGGVGGHVFNIDQTSGTLTEVSGSPFPVLVGRDLVAHPTKTFLYSVSDFGLEIYAYRLDQNTGEPIPLLGSPFSMSAKFPSAVAVDPEGQFLYVLNDAPGPNLYIFRLASDGSLSTVPGSPFETGSRGANSLATSPSGEFVYVTTWEIGNGIFGFHLDRATGQVTQVSRVGVPNTMLTIAAIDKSGQFLYAAEANDLYLFTIDKMTGILTFKGPARESAP